jgi:hypothetical protein
VVELKTSCRATRSSFELKVGALELKVGSTFDIETILESANGLEATHQAEH